MGMGSGENGDENERKLNDVFVLKQSVFRSEGVDA